MPEIKGTSTATGKFPPTVRLENIGDFVRGKVIAKRELPVDSYGHIKPCISLQLIDLSDSASTTLSVGKGEYQEVEVAAGDTVDFVGAGTDLMQKIPQVQLDDIVTITNAGLAPKVKGRNAKKLFKVEVE
jgi:hypothetical protein